MPYKMEKLQHFYTDIFGISMTFCMSAPEQAGWSDIIEICHPHEINNSILITWKATPDKGSIFRKVVCSSLDGFSPEIYFWVATCWCCNVVYLKVLSLFLVKMKTFGCIAKFRCSRKKMWSRTVGRGTLAWWYSRWYTKRINVLLLNSGL